MNTDISWDPRSITQRFHTSLLATHTNIIPRGLHNLPRIAHHRRWFVWRHVCLSLFGANRWQSITRAIGRESSWIYFHVSIHSQKDGGGQKDREPFICAQQNPVSPTQRRSLARSLIITEEKNSHAKKKDKEGNKVSTLPCIRQWNISVCVDEWKHSRDSGLQSSLRVRLSRGGMQNLFGWTKKENL